MGIVEDLYLFDRQNAWHDVFQKMKSQCREKNDYSLKEAKKPEYRSRNRYGDVSPYDHSRISLLEGDINYINASLVKAESADRAYILTQGPLPDTIGHFWLMVWEQKSAAILMLNNLVEKGYIKCHQYFPISDTPSEGAMTFKDVHLKVTFIDELEANATYVIREFLLESTLSGQTRQVLQFHYTSWPDFGVPESPSTFLDFLFVVRKFGYLDDPSKPPIIHCSAGIGRSGTFCLVDTCLVLAEKQGCADNLSVLDELMQMRRYRMGLIQTPEQLRFTYLAIIEGSSRLNCLKHLLPGAKEGVLGGLEDNSDSNEEEDDSISSLSEEEDGDDNDVDDDGGDDDDVDELTKRGRKGVKLLRKPSNDDDSGHHNGEGGDDDSSDDELSHRGLSRKNDKNNNRRQPAVTAEVKDSTTDNNTYELLDRNNNTSHICTNDNDSSNEEVGQDTPLKPASTEDYEDSERIFWASVLPVKEKSKTSFSRGKANVDMKRVKHDERIKKMRETLDRIQQHQRESEAERNRGWCGWMASPYLIGGVSVALLATAWYAYKVVYD